jgi:hypothetical protein
MWDRDILTANEMICETHIELNGEMYKMLEKAYKRKKKVVMRKMDKTKNQAVDRFWQIFTHPDA